MRKSSSNSHKKAQKAHKVKAIFLCVLLFFVANAQAQKLDPVQLFEQVATMIRDNRLAEAEKELNAVLRVTPDLPVALNFLGTIRAKQTRLAEAEALFLRAARNDKSFSGPRMNLAHLYLLQRAPDKAILQLKEVAALEPDNAEAVGNVGRRLHRAK